MNGLVDLRPGADDFRLQHGDALVQLLDRQRVKVLTLEIVQRVLPSARGELVEIHDDSVDPDAGDVNKTVELTFLILRQAGMTTTLPSTMTAIRSEEHTSELQSLMRNSYAVFCLKKKTKKQKNNNRIT